jgi:hypothetical protein
MAIAWSAIESATQEIQNDLNKGISDYHCISAGIYKYLMTSKRSIQESKKIYDAWWQHKAIDYVKELNSLRYSAPVEIHESGHWYAVHYPGSPMRRPQIPANNPIFKVTYKEYFTFHVSSTTFERAWEQVVRFLRALPVLHKELYAYNQRYPGISIKIPNSIWTLLTHPDSIVIHYRQKSLHGAIRDAVLHTYHELGVSLVDRGIKADSGFDLEKIGDPNFEKSHSQLISDIIAKQILKHEKSFRVMPLIKFAKWLEASVEQVSKWTVEQVFKSLYG